MAKQSRPRPNKATGTRGASKSELHAPRAVEPAQPVGQFGPDPDQAKKNKPTLLRIPQATLDTIIERTKAPKNRTGPVLTELLNRLALREDMLDVLWRKSTASPLSELTLAIEALNWASRGFERGYWLWAFAGFAKFLDYFDSDNRRDNYLGLIQWARYRLAFVCQELSVSIEEESWMADTGEGRRHGFRTADSAASYAIALHTEFAKHHRSAVILYNTLCSWSIRARLRASMLFADKPTLETVEICQEHWERKKHYPNETLASKLWVKESPLYSWRDKASEQDRRAVTVLVENAIDALKDLAHDARGGQHSVEQPEAEVFDPRTPVRWVANPSDADLGLFARLAKNDDDLIFVRHDPHYQDRFNEFLSQLESRVGADKSSRFAFERIEQFLPRKVIEDAMRLPHFEEQLHRDRRPNLP